MNNNVHFIKLSLPVIPLTQVLPLNTSGPRFYSVVGTLYFPQFSCQYYLPSSTVLISPASCLLQDLCLQSLFLFQFKKYIFNCHLSISQKFLASDTNLISPNLLSSHSHFVPLWIHLVIQDRNFSHPWLLGLLLWTPN